MIKRTRTGTEDRTIRLVNAAIEVICDNNKWSFLDNINIDSRCIGRDGVHLNKKGCRIVQSNFTTVIDILAKTNDMHSITESLEFV